MNFNALLALGPVLAQVLVIDLVLAGDNAVVIGLAVSNLPPAQRRRAIWLGHRRRHRHPHRFRPCRAEIAGPDRPDPGGRFALIMGGLEKRAGTAPGRDAHAAGPAPAGRLRTAIWRIIVADYR